MHGVAVLVGVKLGIGRAVCVPARVAVTVAGTGSTVEVGAGVFVAGTGVFARVLVAVGIAVGGRGVGLAGPGPRVGVPPG